MGEALSAVPLKTVSKPQLGPVNETAIPLTNATTHMNTKGFIPEPTRSNTGVPVGRRAGCRGAEPQLKERAWHIIKSGPTTLSPKESKAPLPEQLWHRLRES